jgi:hypothetical protein
MDNQELHNSIAKIAETLITTQRNLVTISRSLWAVRISIRELHPHFEQMYQKHWLFVFEGNHRDKASFNRSECRALCT